MSGILGSLGARYAFDRWGGASSAQSAETVVNIDGPKTVRAVWREDYFQPMVVLGFLGIIGGFGAFFGIRHARRRRAGPEQVFKPVSPVKEELKPKLEPSAPVREAEPEKVGEKVEYERYLKRLDELKAQGKISEKVYERLKKKYEAEKGQASNV